MKNAIMSAAFRAALASTLFAGGSFAAEGEYYRGADPSAHASAIWLDMTAPRIRYGFPVPGNRPLAIFTGQTINSGDYYEGATRPY